MTTPVATPQTSDELEELFNDGPRLKTALEDGSFPGLVKNYIEKSAGAPGGEELQRQFSEQMQLGWQNFMRDQGAQGLRPAAGFQLPAGGMSDRSARRARAAARSRMGAARAEAMIEKQALFNERAMGAAVDDESYAESFGKFLYATHKAERDAAKRGDRDEVGRVQDFKEKLNNALFANAMAERVPSEGGFLVPEHLRSEILMVALETAVVRPRAQVIPMDSLRVPMPAIDDISHASSVYGGVQAFWTEEGASLQQSAPSWGRIVLEAKKLTAYTAIPNELLQDSVTPLDMWFNMFFPKAISWFEDVSFISGSGVGQPQGILNSNGAVRVPVASTGSIVFADIAKAYARMWPASMNNAVWLCAPDVLPALLQLAASAGGSAIAPPLFLQNMSATGTPGNGQGDGVHYTLMGRPLIVTEKMPSISGTVPGALTLVDLSYYLLGDRQTMQVASSDEYLFGQDMVAYRIIERLDGRFWLQSPITPENGSSSTLSPLVKIDTTATS